MSHPKQYIVTHRVPDLDAITSTWLLKKFDSENYGIARFAFVDPGNRLSERELLDLNINDDQVTYVDTGLGEFDHHQPDRGQQYLSATSLAYDYICQLHPDLVNDQALRTISEFVTEIDHFKEIFWPDAQSTRYAFMLHELLEGMETMQLHDDDQMLHFGFTCLDAIYTHLTQTNRAITLIAEKGQVAKLSVGRILAITTENDDVIKVAQKQGFMIVIRKDPKQGNIRIKARPDAKLDLKPVYEEIKKMDNKGTWYYHPSGKMVLNGSSKHRQQTPSPLTIEQVVKVIKEVYVV